MVIPVGIFQLILGHGIMGKPFSTLSVWGIHNLLVFCKYAVVMLDRFNRNLDEGMNITKQFLAGNSRFRPIILTTITTFVGLFPLILETSFQSQFLIPNWHINCFWSSIWYNFIIILLPFINFIF